MRRGLALLTLRGGTPENTLALETLEELAAAVEELAADEEVRLIAITGAGEPDLLRGRRPRRRRRAAGLGGLGARLRGARPHRRGRRADGGDAERPRRRRRDRPGAGVRLAHRRRGRAPAVHPQRARLLAAVGRGRAARPAHPGAGRAAALRDVRARLDAGGARRWASSTTSAAPHRLLGRVEALLTRIERADRVARHGDEAPAPPGHPARGAHGRVRGALGRARGRITTLPA